MLQALNFSVFVKSLIMSFALEGGIFTNSISLLTPDPTSKYVSIDESYYTDMQTNLEIMRYLNVYGGMTAYELGTKIKGFYPVRMDFTFGVAGKYKALTIGYEHGCFHPMVPLENTVLPWKVDNATDRVFARIEVSKRLFGD